MGDYGTGQGPPLSLSFKTQMNGLGINIPKGEPRNQENEFTLKLKVRLHPLGKCTTGEQVLGHQVPGFQFNTCLVDLHFYRVAKEAEMHWTATRVEGKNGATKFMYFLAQIPKIPRKKRAKG